jgi:hypothetical protein
MERIRKLADIYVIASKCLPTLKEDMLSGLIDILDMNAINTPVSGFDNNELMMKTEYSSCQQKKTNIFNTSVQFSNKITGKYNKSYFIKVPCYFKNINQIYWIKSYSFFLELK